MKNSLLPLAMVMTVTLLAVLLIRPAAEPAVEGPIINPGIFRLPKRAGDLFREQQGLRAEHTVRRERAEDRRVALEPDSWQRVVITASDSSGTTRAVVNALAERLTDRGVMVIIDTEGSDPLALPSDRNLTVTTLAAERPADAGGPFMAELRVALGGLRLPPTHPAARRMPAGGVLEQVLAITHRSRTEGTLPRETLRWARWWAAVGRSIADATLAELMPEGVHVAWSSGAIDWGSRVPSPPTIPVVRWRGAFEHPLIRGWVGVISGTSVRAKDGSQEDALKPWIRIMARGKWEEARTTDPPRREWVAIRDGQELRCSVQPNADGWDLACWQERREEDGKGGHLLAAGIHDRWLSAAIAGDRAARSRLRAHLTTPEVPADQQQSAGDLLAREPDLAEAAMLAAVGRPEQPAVARARWVLGRAEPAGADGGWPRLVRGEALRLPSRSALVQADATSIVLLVDGEVRGECWLRTGDTSPRRVDLPAIGATVRVGLPAGELEIARAADGLSLAWR